MITDDSNSQGPEKSVSSTNLEASNLNNNNVLSRTISIWSDAIEDGLDDFNGNDSLFELPIKGDLYHNRNFKSNDDTDLPIIANNNKKVRFENSNEVGEEGDDENENSLPLTIGGAKQSSHSSAMPTPKKRNIEELLEYSSQVNDFISHNLDRIDKLRADIMTDDGLYLPTSTSNLNLNTTTIPSDYVSNFELSEKDFGSEMLAPTASSQVDDDFDDDNINILKAPKKLNFSTSTSSLFSSGRNTPVSQPPRSLTPNEFFYTLNEQIKNIKNLKVTTTSCQDKIDKTISDCLLFSNYNDEITNDTPEIDQDAAIDFFHDNISLIQSLSLKTTPENEPNESFNSNIICQNYMEFNVNEANEYSTFAMKSLPTLSYNDFIKRIHSKCELGPTVYLSASYLLQILFLTRDEKDGSIKLKRKLLDNEVHRLVIATIRLSAKLLNDSVHSHLYVSKVCGVSKKLLTKIETSLLMCLIDENIFVTCRQLNAPKFILKEIKSMIPTNFDNN